MQLPQFDDLPFNARPDLSPYLLHLTKNTKKPTEKSAFKNLVSILKTGRIHGSTSKTGMIKGKNPAACFMDVPLASLKYVLTPENSDPQKPRYEPYGVAITKKYGHKHGCRPVLYLSDQETKDIGIPSDELWRVVRFEVSKKGWVSWLHEREWRCKGTFKLPRTIQAAFVRNAREANELSKLLAKRPDDFRCTPQSVIPLTVLCQGLLK